MKDEGWRCTMIVADAKRFHPSSFILHPSRNALIRAAVPTTP
jgi:hypothetical protein